MKIENVIKRLVKAGYEVENKSNVIFVAKKGGAVIEFVDSGDGEAFYFDVGGHGGMPFQSLKATMEFASQYV